MWFHLTVLLFAVLGFGAASYYIGTLVYVIFFRKKTNVVETYGNQWGIVTGASSGLGLSMCEELCKQGVKGIVMVALGDSVLEKSHAELQKKYPKVELRAVGCDLSDYENRSYMAPIITATKNLKIGYVFSNAGYGFDELMSDVSEKSLRAHIECLATSSIIITTHFYQKMVETKRRGCVVFTSSMASFVPSTICATYSAAKGMLSAHASVLAVEAHHYQIDVLCLQPGYISTPFQANLEGMELLKNVAWMGQTPRQVVNHAFQSLGYFSFLDTGMMAWLTRVFDRLAGQNGMVWSQKLAQGMLPDFKNHINNSAAERKRRRIKS